jgi:hypothetical protein
MAHIKLTNTYLEAEVDDEDRFATTVYFWHISYNGYARATVNNTGLYLHKFIAQRMGLKGKVDHKDRNKLNCKRNNLREATNTQNNANSTRKLNTTGCTGVYENYDKFIAVISINDKLKYLGRFSTIEEASYVYRKKHIELHGEFSPYYNDVDLQ